MCDGEIPSHSSFLYQCTDGHDVLRVPGFAAAFPNLHDCFMVLSMLGFLVYFLFLI